MIKNKRTSNEIVREFYAAFREPIHEGAPSASESVISQERLELKISLIMEEMAELLGAAFNDKLAQDFEQFWSNAKSQGMLNNPKRDIVEMFDAVVDLDVVLNGLAIETGMPVESGLLEVHNSNMTKLVNDEAIRSDGTDGYPKGKILKGPDYVAPNLKQVLLNHGAEL